MAEKEERMLEQKRRVLKRWTIALSIIAILSFVGLGGMIIERLLKGAPGGGLAININKLEKKLAWLGAEIRDLDYTISKELGLASTSGVLINNVEKDSPADKAGLERGDVILLFNGTQIKDSFQIQEEILKYKPGNTVKIVVDKANSGRRIVYVKLGTRPQELESSSDKNIKKIANTSGATAEPRLSTPWGISVSALTEDLREQFNIPSSEQGVVIVAVAKNSLADRQGLEVGDVVASINQAPTPNLQSFYLTLEKNEGVLMDIYSPDDGKRFFVTFPDEGDSPPQAVLMDFTEEESGKGRIAIASDSDNLDGAVFARFSSSPYFILYDIEKKEMAIIKNPYAAQIRGMGIAVAQMLIQKDIDGVIVGGIGPQAFDAFYLAKIKVYGSVTGSVRDAIMNYQLGRLNELKEANLGGYGYSSSALRSTGSSPWTEESDSEEEGGYKGQPQTIPPKGKAESETMLTAGGEPRVNRVDICICPNCGAEVTHPASTSCSEMVCPICGSRLMNASPGNVESGPAELPLQLPATEIPLQIRPIALAEGMFVSNAPITSSSTTMQRVSDNLWAISSKPQDIPPMVGQQTASISTQFYTTSQVTTCVCPLDGTIVTHPVGIPCAALQCPTCGGRMVSGANLQTGGNPMTQTAGMQTGGMQTGGSPMMQTGGMQSVVYIPVAGGPTQGGPNTGGPDVGGPTIEGLSQVVYIPVAGGATQGGPNTGGPTSGGPAIDGPSLGGGQSGTGAAQSGRSTECICPMCKTTVTHPIGVPCTSLTCPVCGSRLLNAQPGGASGGAAGMQTGGNPMTQTAGMQTGGIQTGGKPEGVPPVQQTYYLVPVSSKPDNVPLLGQGQQVVYIPVAGGATTSPTIGPLMEAPEEKKAVRNIIPVAGGATQGGPNTGGPTSGGPAIDGPSLGGGQSGTGAAQSGRSTECICPMCKTTVTHPIGVPCTSLTCPVCGSRLVNAQPGGASGGAAGMLTASTMPVTQSKVIQVSTVSRKIAVASTGRSLSSDIAQLFDKAPYFMMFGLGKYELIRNPYYRDTRATGAEVAQFVVGEGGAIVICNNISMTALKALKDLQVKVYSGFTGTVQQAVDIYADGRLKDSGTITGIVIEDGKTSDHEGGGGPPSSKDKRKDKGDSEVF